MEMIVNVKRMRMRCKHMDDISLHRYNIIIHTYISTAIFLVAMINVGLAQARSNNNYAQTLYTTLYIHTIIYPRVYGT